jgi:hypothetical protein
MAAADRDGAAAWHPSAPRHDNHRYASPGRLRVIDARPGGRHARDRAQAWLRSAVIALGVLAAAAAAVSWDAQYVLVASVKRNMAVARWRPASRTSAR